MQIIPTRSNIKSVQGHLVSLTGYMGRAARDGSHKDLAAWVSSEDFLASLAALPPNMRASVFATHAKAWAKCEARAPMIPHAKQKVAWDDIRKARLRKLAPNYPNTPAGNAGLAAVMGLSPGQVRLARSRYARGLGAPATVSLAKAA